MIFDTRIINESEIAKINIEDSDMYRGIYLLSYIIDNKLYLADIDFDNNIIIEAKNTANNGKFKSGDVGLPPYIPGTGRGMLIGKGAGHNGRMKVANKGKDVTDTRGEKTKGKRTIAKKDKNANVSFHVADERKGIDGVEIDGDIKNIAMKNDEFKLYKQFTLDHNALIQLAFNNNDNLDEIQAALMYDTNVLDNMNDITYERDRDGNLTIYNNRGKVIHKGDLNSRLGEV